MAYTSCTTKGPRHGSGGLFASLLPEKSGFDLGSSHVRLTVDGVSSLFTSKNVGFLLARTGLKNKKGSE